MDTNGSTKSSVELVGNKFSQTSFVLTAGDRVNRDIVGALDIIEMDTGSKAYRLKGIKLHYDYQ